LYPVIPTTEEECTMEIQGRMTFQPIETGFWGLIDAKGRRYLPLHVPEPLKKENAAVVVQARPSARAITIFQWGIPIEIDSFHLVSKG
jgi:hypothetical protein